jgi:hypothetical protein
MPLRISLVIALAGALAVTTAADAAAKHKKRSPRDKGYYGFLPGYRSPERIAWERAHQPPAYGYGGWYRFGYYGNYEGFYWNGRPGFYNGRWNGGSFGPCWTRTPIGPVWNCGK